MEKDSTFVVQKRNTAVELFFQYVKVSIAFHRRRRSHRRRHRRRRRRNC